MLIFSLSETRFPEKHDLRGFSPIFGLIRSTQGLFSTQKRTKWHQTVSDVGLQGFFSGNIGGHFRDFENLGLMTWHVMTWHMGDNRQKNQKKIQAHNFYWNQQ